MGRTVTFSWPSHGKDLAAGIWKLFKEEFKTDFQVSINGTYINGHHLILAAFCSRIKVTENSAFILGEIPSVNKEDVEILFRFLYCGQLNVDEDRLPSLKILANMLGFKTLVDIIDKFFNSKKHDLKNLRRKCRPIKQPEKSNCDSPAKQNATSNVLGDVLMKEETGNVPEVSHEVVLDEDPEEEVLKHNCQLCDYKTNNKSNLAGHMINKHQVDLNGKPHPKNIKCPECPFVCSALFQLKNHTYQRHSQKRSVCTECGYRCHGYAAMELHKKLAHSDAKPFICETCGYQAKIAAHLRRHMLIHSGEKATCDVCGSSVSVRQLNQHKKIHSNQPKPHRCNLCKFSSWKSWNLKFHLKTVHKVKADSSNFSSEVDNNFASEESVQALLNIYQ